MTSILFDILQMVVLLLPFMLLCKRSVKVNLAKADRGRQLFMPVISLFIVIFLMIMESRANELIMNMIKRIPALLFMLGQTFAPLRNVCTNLAAILLSFINRTNWELWLPVVIMPVIMLVYLEVKRIFLAVLKRIFKGGADSTGIICQVFYEFNQDTNKWCLKEKYTETRKLFRTLYWTAVAVSCTMMIATRFFYMNGELTNLFYPVYGIILVGELYFCLDGYTRREYSDQILGENEDAVSVVNYSLLRKYLRSLFRDKLLAENTSINSGLAYDVTNEEIINSFEMDEDPMVQSYGAYIKRLNEGGFQFDHNYLYSGLDLLKGKSILFNNPFYNDLIPYAFYPMNRKLLSHKKVLVVLGRHGIEDDIRAWLEKGIGSVTNVPYLWNIEVLSEEQKKTDIGILTRSALLNMNVQNANADFFSEVEFIVIIEPSKLISTAQIGLNLVIKKCKEENDGKELVYCLSDKNCDGLVDAMSHVLMTSIVEVSATRKHRGTVSHMCWEADDTYLHHRMIPNISRYLGVGTELSFSALKNQISRTKWYGGDAFPVVDMNWITKQYYYELMMYAGLPTNQEAMNEHFQTSFNMWSAAVEQNSFVSVEDEDFNMFEILREFATRSASQGFVNVISSEYLLKDYMAENASIFEIDAKAIPNIVPDYARTRRNTTLRILLMLSSFRVPENVLEKELSLIGIRSFQMRKQLWLEIYNCFENRENISRLPEKYEEAVEAAASLTLGSDGNAFGIDILREGEEYNYRKNRMEKVFFIKNRAFTDTFIRGLKSAGYVAEDEKGEKNYIGAELTEQIYQKYLPGQFFTLSGKYYEMLYLTAGGEILVRRAADHITNRYQYRQLRRYRIQAAVSSEQIGDSRIISGMKIVRQYADFSVETPGYYRMTKYNDFPSSKKILLDRGKTGIPERTYKNKQILKINLSEENGQVTDEIRYTVTVLMNEVFRTLFAENHAYIVAVTDTGFLGTDVDTVPLTYTVEADSGIIDSTAIYILEDSQLDLGLLEATERNLKRIFEIICDYLDWHLQAMEDSINPPEPVEVPVNFGGFEEPQPETMKEKLASLKIVHTVKKVIEKLKNIFGRKKKQNTEESLESETMETPMQEAEVSAPETETPVPETEEPTTDDGESDVIPDVGEPGEEPSEEEPIPADEICFDKPESIGIPERAPYHLRHYLLFGAKAVPDAIEPNGAYRYLEQNGFADNSLKKARDGKHISAFIEATFMPNKPAARYCDYCGTEIIGCEYETLSDGTDRCMSCGRTAIRTAEEFEKLYKDVKRNMETFFGIRINAGIKVEMVNSRTLHKRLKKQFTPTSNMDARIVGVAIKEKDSFTLLIENGAPRMSSTMTIAHELTHIWQYLNWDAKQIRQTYGGKLELEIYEGMAKWAEIQYAYLMNESSRAKREEIITRMREDEYGHGFLRYLANYPLTEGTVLTRETPFMKKEEPLEKEFCGEIIIPKNE